ATPWHGGIRSAVIAVVSAFNLLVGAGFLAGSALAGNDPETRWVLAGIGLFVTLLSGAILTMSQISVTADHTGLTIAWGPWRWPRTKVALADIENATTEHIQPGDWGGW